MKTWEKAEVFAIAYLKPLNKASCNKNLIFSGPPPHQIDFLILLIMSNRINRCRGRRNKFL